MLKFNLKTQGKIFGESKIPRFSRFALYVKFWVSLVYWFNFQDQIFLLCLSGKKEVSIFCFRYFCIIFRYLKLEQRAPLLNCNFFLLRFCRNLLFYRKIWEGFTEVEFYKLEQQNINELEVWGQNCKMLFPKLSAFVK